MEEQDEKEKEKGKERGGEERRATMTTTMMTKRWRWMEENQKKIRGKGGGEKNELSQNLSGEYEERCKDEEAMSRRDSG